MNLKIREFTKSITDFVAGYDLPPEVKKICLENVLYQVNISADKAVVEEINQTSQGEGKEEENHAESI